MAKYSRSLEGLAAGWEAGQLRAGHAHQSRRLVLRWAVGRREADNERC